MPAVLFANLTDEQLRRALAATPEEDQPIGSLEGRRAVKLTPGRDSALGLRQLTRHPAPGIIESPIPSEPPPIKTAKPAKTKKPKKAGSPPYAGPAPTGGIYGALAASYDHFNGGLFGGRLPPCLLTLRAKDRTYGYFSPGRFTAGGAAMEKVDELAMNPARFSTRELRDTLSTVAHVEHQHFGSPGSGGYHNKEFARLMARIGLVCSDTGKPGGKQTGRQMTHYIVDGEPFDLSCTKLMGQGFTLPWAEPPPPGLEGWEPPDKLLKRLPDADEAERVLRAVMRAMAKARAADKLALRHAAEIVAATGHSPAA